MGSDLHGADGARYRLPRSQSGHQLWLPTKFNFICAQVIYHIYVNNILTLCFIYLLCTRLRQRFEFKIDLSWFFDNKMVYQSHDGNDIRSWKYLHWFRLFNTVQILWHQNNLKTLLTINITEIHNLKMEMKLWTESSASYKFQKAKVLKILWCPNHATVVTLDITSRSAFFFFFITPTPTLTGGKVNLLGVSYSLKIHRNCQY